MGVGVLPPPINETLQYTLYKFKFLLVQSVVGLEKGDPIYWEPGKLKLKLQHTFSKQALAVSELLPG